MSYGRRTPGFHRHALLTKVVLMAAGFVLMGLQLADFFILER
jgi:hypothetical protein